MLKIGIAACFFHEDPKRAIFKGMTLQYIEQNVAHWLMQREVLAFMVPSPEGRTRRAGSKATLAAYAQELDGLVLMGGSDVCPESYGEKALRPEWNGDRIRDEYEIALLREFMALSKPVLGVCRGAQVINVGLGGTLFQDIATQVPGALNHRNWAIYEENCHATSLVPGERVVPPLPRDHARQDQLGPPPGREGARPRPRRRSVVGAGSHRRGDPLYGSGVRVRGPVAPGIPRAGTIPPFSTTRRSSTNSSPPPRSTRPPPTRSSARPHHAFPREAPSTEPT